MGFLAGDHSDVSQVSPPVSFTTKLPPPTGCSAELQPEGPGNSAICNRWSEVQVAWGPQDLRLASEVRASLLQDFALCPGSELTLAKMPGWC